MLLLNMLLFNKTDLIGIAYVVGKFSKNGKKLLK